MAGSPCRGARQTFRCTCGFQPRSSMVWSAWLADLQGCRECSPSRAACLGRAAPQPVIPGSSDRGSPGLGDGGDVLGGGHGLSGRDEVAAAVFDAAVEVCRSTPPTHLRRPPPAFPFGFRSIRVKLDNMEHSGHLIPASQTCAGSFRTTGAFPRSDSAGPPKALAGAQNNIRDSPSDAYRMQSGNGSGPRSPFPHAPGRRQVGG